MDLNPSGVLLASSWFNMLLYSTVVVMSISYFMRYSVSVRSSKYVLSAALIVDTISTLIVCANVFMNVIPLRRPDPEPGANPPNPPQDFNPDPRPLYQPWLLPILTITTGLSAVFGRLVLSFRCWRLIRVPALTVTILCLIAANVAFAFVSGTSIATRPNSSLEGFAKSSFLVGGVLGAATDIFLAVLLSARLFTSDAITEVSMSGALRNVITTIIETGSFAAASSIALLVLILIDNSAFIVVLSFIGRIYSLTLVTNYLMIPPTELQADPRPLRSESTWGALGSFLQHGNTRAPSIAEASVGVSVHRATVARYSGVPSSQTFGNTYSYASWKDAIPSGLSLTMTSPHTSLPPVPPSMSPTSPTSIHHRLSQI